MVMLCTSEIDMADTINENDVADFLTNAAWDVCSTCHTVLKTSQGVAILGRDMLCDIPFLVDWSKNRGIQKKKQTDKNTFKENSGHVK
jgi:hypothetical protein